MGGPWKRGKSFPESSTRRHTYESLVKLLGKDERMLFKLQCLVTYQRQRLLFCLNSPRCVKGLMNGGEPDVKVCEVGKAVLLLLKGVT